jgi:heat-inducible transcriptional repressor
VENRMMIAPAGLPASALIEAGNYLSARLKGRTLKQAADEIRTELAERRAALDEAASALVEKGLADWSGGEDRSLIIRGQAQLLDNVGAAEDLERIRMLFDELERKEGLITLLDKARDAEGVRLFIGAENPLFSLSGSSVIVAPYMDSERRIIGALGVIGPTRLNYARVIPLVDYTARVVGRLLDKPRS